MEFEDSFQEGVVEKSEGYREESSSSHVDDLNLEFPSPAREVSAVWCSPPLTRNRGQGNAPQKGASCRKGWRPRKASR